MRYNTVHERSEQRKTRKGP